MNNSGGSAFKKSITYKEEAKEIDIEISTLDKEVPAADLIKIDTQGAEFLILQGATRILESSPALILEFWPFALKENSCDPLEFLNFLLERHIVYKIGKELIRITDSQKMIDECLSVKNGKGQVDLFCRKEKK